MKWMNPLWRDPVGWSEKAAKTKLRVLVLTLIHLTSILVGLAFLCIFICSLPGLAVDRFDIVMAMVIGGLPIVCISVTCPAMYLYAMHRLLKLLREKDTQNKRSDGSS